jgi:hypothetical protein
MANPGLPTSDPMPGGNIPSEVPPPPIPDEMPDTGPTGPRTPYPVNDPGISEPKGPGSEPDYLPVRPPIQGRGSSVLPCRTRPWPQPHTGGP